MKLNRLTERIWFFPFEAERDRPNLAYVRGDRWSLAVDAGHSSDHVCAFYAALEDAGLPLPQLTVLTHWHWDHSFGMHAIHGLSVSNMKTNQYLSDFRHQLEQKGMPFFLSIDESIRLEYRDGKEAVIVLPDLVFEKEMLLDAGNCSIRIFEADSPHTDDCTLIEIPGERVLLVGDAACGTFPEKKKDPLLCEKFAQTIRESNADIFLEGHKVPESKTEAMNHLFKDSQKHE
ncbi:MAG: MBL fold metallo-hydrolase [Clostridia bacterium]|nr:MBL fold metallo-hydrolase [Clostridia bacterium]